LKDVPEIGIVKMHRIFFVRLGQRVDYVLKHGRLRSALRLQPEGLVGMATLYQVVHEAEVFFLGKLDFPGLA
jgi:hypothetical protein